MHQQPERTNDLATVTLSPNLRLANAKFHHPIKRDPVAVESLPYQLEDDVVLKTKALTAFSTYNVGYSSVQEKNRKQKNKEVKKSLGNLRKEENKEEEKVQKGSVPKEKNE